MSIKRIMIISLLIAAVTIFSGCTLRKDNKAGEWEQYGTKGPKKIGLILSASEKESYAVNEAVSAAANKASLEQGAEYKVFVPGDLANDRETLRYLAENQYDLILTIGRGIEKDLAKAAAEYPDIQFALVGGEVESPNVTSIKFDKSEGAFLAGVLAASVTKSQSVGFIGASESGDGRIMNGFARGVQYINLVEGKKIKVTVAYAGVTSEAGADSNRGYTLANNLYWSGSDVIFCTFGKMVTGVVKSAAENKRLTITSDARLLNDFPWNVYGAVTDKQDSAVYDLIRKGLAGKLNGGLASFGVVEGAVDLTVSVNAPEEIKAKLNDVRQKIKNGQLKSDTIIIPEGLVTEVSQMPIDWSKIQPGAGGIKQEQGSQNQNLPSGSVDEAQKPFSSQ